VSLKGDRRWSLSKKKPGACLVQQHATRTHVTRKKAGPFFCAWWSVTVSEERDDRGLLSLVQQHGLQTHITHKRSRLALLHLLNRHRWILRRKKIFACTPMHTQMQTPTPTQFSFWSYGALSVCKIITNICIVTVNSTCTLSQPPAYHQSMDLCSLKCSLKNAILCICCVYVIQRWTLWWKFVSNCPQNSFPLPSSFSHPFPLLTPQFSHQLWLLRSEHTQKRNIRSIIMATIVNNVYTWYKAAIFLH